ncbi:MAG: PAS domain S-box protein [Candidatus Omnitrophota bacterium]|jgi:PAS domain S-box-containing protein
MKFKGKTKKKITRKEEQGGISGQKVYLESIMSSMTDSLIVVNPDATLRSVNKAALELLGYEEGELIGHPVKKIFLQGEAKEEAIKEEGRSALHKYFQKIIVAGVAYNIGLTFLTKQGKSIPINFSGALMQQDGKIVGIVGVARDMRQIMAVISDLEEKKRKLEESGENLTRMRRAMLYMMDDLVAAKRETEKAGQAIKDTAYQFQAVVESVGEGITFSDSSGKFSVYNLKMQELTGYTVDEANNIGDFTKFLYPQPLERQKALQRLQEIVEHKVALPLEVETTIQAKDGTWKVLWVSTVEMRFKDQEMFLSIYRDITGRKNAEEALKKANDELKMLRDNLEVEVEKKIQEIRLVQDKLARSERLVALGQFAGAIGHEFRNQLGVIRNVAYFLKMKLADEEDKKIVKHLNILEEEIINTDNTIENLLAFARGKKPELSSVDIKELLLASIEMSKVPPRITVVVQIDKDLPVIEADPIKLNRVFVNIILNAVEAIKKTGRVLIRETRKGSDIDIRIEDTGSGIEPEDKKRIFEPAFTTKPRGTGLGLATARAFIESHGGTIDVESEAGKGTAVIISLPIKQHGAVV